MRDEIGSYVSKDDASELARSMYLGERCLYCGRVYKTLSDLEDTVWAGYHERGRLACKACWDKHHTEQADQ